MPFEEDGEREINSLKIDGIHSTCPAFRAF